VSTVPLTPADEARVEERALVAARRGGVRRETAWAVACLALDGAMLLAAAVAAAYGAARAGVAVMPVHWMVAFAAMAISLWAVRDLYQMPLRIRLLDDVARIATSTAVAAMTVLSLRLLLGADADAVMESARLAVFTAVYVGAGRVAFSRATTSFWRAGSRGRPTLIVGAGRVGRLVARRLLEEPNLGLRPVAFLDEDPLPDPGGDDDLPPVAGGAWDLERVVEEYGIRQVVLTFSSAPDEVFLRVAERCQALGLAVSIVPRLYERVPDRVDVSRLGGLPLLTVRPSNPHGVQFAVKYALDPLLAAISIVAFSPLLVLAALAVWIESGRPILFRQVRVGRDGRRFELLKFRSMDSDDDDHDQTEITAALLGNLAPGGVEGRDRRTRVGSILRRASIDELPQLFNVLRGQMSMVGPRPERPQFVSDFQQRIYRYDDRHRVKGGITGWAQVHGLRGRTSLADRAEWDNYYIENFSLWLDFKILLMTVGTVLRSIRTVE
jgi:exopolysaccharide biosynthesis polyprenyl glycosylphosphotransferase